ncbi:hypothetical protein Aph02nite_33780 [Actinoplanes philippinensis]|uniref:2'-5' RNA ligase superfamily protein n=1 Tax=Actinoplanes philippinensis TaxID=35752 RepID=A0A1I2DWH3_9ACTN|nr:hypothetical protein [Actinoplanes philippinensis]GIE77428.1 hypothetical protein Aph02nite_33780 [Actinoplanes philippinensis]SFE84916.1 hypothetical protein SAMN05421541_10425 [Actinoplanes philippinensis]
MSDHHRPGRQVSRAAFDRLFRDGSAAVSTGEHRVQSPPVEGGFRWGLSALLPPDPTAAATLDRVAHEAAAAAGGRHWITGAAATSHLTLRSLEPWRAVIEDGDPLVNRYAVALGEAVRGIGPLTFTVTGLTLTPGSVMACAVPADDRADRLADAYGTALGADGWHENEFTRDFWYLNLLHFAEPVENPDRLIAWVAGRRDREITTVVVGEVRLTRWGFAGSGMVPHVVAASPLT